MSGIYWLASYPKSGNTWFRVFLQNLLEDGDAPADINALRTGHIASSRSWLDDVLGFDTADLTPEEIAALRPEVYRWHLRSNDIGYYKIHDAWSVTPQGEALASREATLGALYLIRSPLDVAPSAAHHWQCSVDEAIERMASPDMGLMRARGGLYTQVTQRLLTWSAHVLSWVDAPGLRCLVVRYEDLVADPLPTFTAAAEFLEAPHDEARVARAIQHSSFDEVARQESERGFRERPARAPRFFRHGTSGGWRDQLTPQQVARLVADHGEVMRRFGYLDERGEPV